MMSFVPLTYVPAREELGCTPPLPLPLPEKWHSKGKEDAQSLLYYTIYPIRLSTVLGKEFLKKSAFFVPLL
jgi:hypothetical protein